MVDKHQSRGKLCPVGSEDVSEQVDKSHQLHIMGIACPRGGIGIHGRLRACAHKGVPVRVGPGAF